MKWYYINTASEKVGPISSQALKALAENGVIQRHTVIFSGDGKKSEAEKVRGLFPESEKTSSDSAISNWSQSTTPQPLPPQPQPDPFTLFQLSTQPDPFALPPKTHGNSESQNSGGIVFAVSGVLVSLGILVAVAVFLGMPKSDNVMENVKEHPVSLPEEQSAEKTIAEPVTVLPSANALLTKLPPKPAPNFEPKSTEEIIAAVESSIVLIRGENGNGSGFVVLPGVIATNSHVIGSENIDDLEIIFPSERGSKNGGPFKAKLLYEDADRDLAFLEISSKQQPPLNIVQNYKFRRGQKIIAIGNPGKGDGTVLENAVCEGILSTQTDVDKQPYYQLSIAINAGNSGGPVLDETGRVLGVVTLKATKTEAMAFCIPPDALCQALEAVKRFETATIQSAAKRHAARISLFRGLEKLSMFPQVPESKQPEFAKEVLADFNEAVQKNPQDPLAFLGRGIFKVVLDDIDGALKDFDQAVQLAPDRPEFAELRDKVRIEWEQRQQTASRAGIPSNKRFAAHFPGIPPIPMQPRLPIPRPSIPMSPMVGDASEMSLQPTPQEKKAQKIRYQQILEKEEWIFDGKPMYGKISGYEKGIVFFQLKEAIQGVKSVERNAKKFSEEDIEDIRFYAKYHGLQCDDL